MLWLPTILILPYIVLLLKLYRNLLQIKPFKTTSLPETFVSVVVACRNEEKNIIHLLKNIINQDYPENLFEVIIVDDNSTDRTFGLASEYMEYTNVKVVNNKGSGKKQAIRTGIGVSSGQLIITTDADCVMGPGWIRTIAEFFEKENADMIICPVKLADGNSFFKKFQEIEFMSLQGITAGTASAGNATMCNGANMAFKKNSYLDNSANLHDELLSGDDIFLLHSMKKQALSKIYWLESVEAMVTTALSPTVVRFLEQRKRWISKGRSYNDIATITLSIVTFVTIILQLSIFFASIINPANWVIYLTLFLIKSMVDFLILRNTIQRYGNNNLMKWFFPAQVVYPFYVIIIICYTLFTKKAMKY